MKIKDPLVPSHDAELMHHGAISLELFPNGTADSYFQIPVWDYATQQWYMARLIGGPGLDISFSATEATLEIVRADDRVYGSYTGDAILLATQAGTFTADAVLV